MSKTVVKEIEITPVVAEEMLKKNTRNRNINRRHVEFLAKEMTAGRWMANGSTFVFDSDGYLIDGQHRLHGVIKSGVTIKALIVLNADPTAFMTIDAGRKRTTADNLTITGEKNATHLSSALALLDRYLTKRIFFIPKHSSAELEQLLNNNPGIRDYVTRAIGGRYLASVGLLTTCFYLFSQKDKEACDLFMEKLINGCDLTKSDPIYVLRERLMKNNISKAKLSKIYLFALIIKTWNTVRMGKPALGVLKLVETEDFPEII